MNIAMKPIELNKFEDFKFLSALKLSGKGNEIFFVVTKVDRENNGYLQQLNAINVRSRKVREVTGWEKDSRGEWKYETDDSLNMIRNSGSIEKRSSYVY